MDVEVSKESIFWSVVIKTPDASITRESINRIEALDLAKQFIKAAEDLLLPKHSKKVDVLAMIRKDLKTH